MERMVTVRLTLKFTVPESLADKAEERLLEILTEDDIEIVFDRAHAKRTKAITDAMCQDVLDLLFPGWGRDVGDPEFLEGVQEVLGGYEKSGRISKEIKDLVLDFIESEAE